MANYEKCLTRNPTGDHVCTRPKGHYGRHQAWDHVRDRPLAWVDPFKEFDSQNWTPYQDERTNAELKAAWEALGRSNPKTPEEAKDVMYRQDLIHFQLTMREYAHIGDAWVHPRRADKEPSVPSSKGQK